MIDILKTGGGIGKKFALIGALGELQYDTTNLALMDPHFTTLSRMIPKVDHIFRTDLNVMTESPYDLYSEFQIHDIEPYNDIEFTSRSNNLKNIYLKQIERALNIPESNKTKDHINTYKWGKYINVEKIKHNNLLLFQSLDKVKNGKIAVIECDNSRHDPTDTRTFTYDNTNKLTSYLLDEGYTIVVLSSILGTFETIISNLPFIIEGNLHNPNMGNPKLMFAYDILIMAIILREYASIFVSIDSHLPHLANTSFVRENKELNGIVFWHNTSPVVFGYPNNINIKPHPDTPNRTFGLPIFDGYDNSGEQITREYDIIRYIDDKI